MSIWLSNQEELSLNLAVFGQRIVSCQQDTTQRLLQSLSVPQKGWKNPSKPSKLLLMKINTRAVIFNHIPKTAGQSLHNYLLRNYSDSHIFCPARVNNELDALRDTAKYSFFSGHFDVRRHEFENHQTFHFTVLRDPVDRLLSFYFFQRAQAMKLSKESLQADNQKGNRFAIELSPDDFFCSNHELRDFIDFHYHNFYTRFLLEGKFIGTELILARIRNLDHKLLEEAYALNPFDRIYGIGNFMKIIRDIDFFLEISRNPTKQSQESPKLNVSPINGKAAKFSALGELGATKKTLNAIEEMVYLDNGLIASLRSGDVLQ